MFKIEILNMSVKRFMQIKNLLDNPWVHMCRAVSVQIHSFFQRSSPCSSSFTFILSFFGLFLVLFKCHFLSSGWYIKQDGLNWYLQDIPSKNNKIHFLLKCSWNILQVHYILGHKSNVGKFKKIEIVSSIFSNHNVMTLDINYRKNSVKNTNTWA